MQNSHGDVYKRQGFTYAHGMQALQDPFVGELIGNICMETEEKGYYVMLIGGEDIQNVVDIASKWNVEGLIILGYNEERYRSLSRKLNKKMILIDAYPEGAYTFQNVGVDDYSGGYQIGEYFYSCGSVSYTHLDVYKRQILFWEVKLEDILQSI